MFLSSIRRSFAKIIDRNAAVGMIRAGDMVMCGGFGICGNANWIIKGIGEKSETIKNLTLVSNNGGIDDYGVGILIKNKQVKRVIFSYVGENRTFERAYLNGEIEFDITPQGTLAEKIRSGGKGLPAIWTPTGVGTLVETGGFPMKFKPGGKGEVEIFTEPKETRVFKGKKYLLEDTLFADVALIRAHKADKKGNLQYRHTARNLNEDMATAAKIVIAEVDEIVENGEIDPNQVHTPGIYVDYVVKTGETNKPIERPVYDEGEGVKLVRDRADERIKIAKRVAKEVKNGMYVNLGIGIPTLVPAFISPELQIEIQGENGSLGATGYPKRGEEDGDLINASKECIKVGKGASFFPSSESFGMIRGGHLDMTILGAMQVSATGDIANWIIPGKLVKGMGGAMDLVACGSTVIVAMEHTAKGSVKIFEKCTLPLTGKGVCKLLVTDKAVFDFASGRITLKEIAEGHTVDDIRKMTGCTFDTYPQIGTF
mgnify:CR=1 FL=1